MRRGVDAAGEARDDQKPGLGQLARQTMREHATVRAGVASTNHGNGRSLQQLGLAAHGQERRRVGDLGETFGIFGFALGQERAAELGDRRELGLGLVAPAALPTIFTTRLAGQAWQLVQRPARVAETAQQLAEGLGTDSARAAELQPVDLLVA